jgi:hypothetical protein
MSIPSSQPDIVASTHSKEESITDNAYRSLARRPSYTAPTTGTTHTNIIYSPLLAGWVSALKVVSRIQTTPASDQPPHPSLEDNDCEGDRKQGERTAWRETWVVIHDGVINICKSPNVRYLFFIRPTEQLFDLWFEQYVRF